MLGTIPKRLFVLASIAIVGCFPSVTGTPIDVESDYFYYPIGLGLTQPEGRYLLVVSSNFDLSFSSGALVPVHLAEIDGVIDACREGEDANGCTDFVVSNESELDDSGDRQLIDFVLEDHAVRVGSYASSLAVTEHLALVPVRSDASLRSIVVDEVEPDQLDQRRLLRCADGEDSDTLGGLQSCSSDRIVTAGWVRATNPVILPTEPFAIATWTDPYACPTGQGCYCDPRFEDCRCSSSLPESCVPGDDQLDCGGEDLCLCDEKGDCYCGDQIAPSCDPEDDTTCSIGQECLCTDDAGCRCQGEGQCGSDYVVVGHMTGDEISLFERIDGAEQGAANCNDGRDNDSDGLDDFDDPGCQGSYLRLIDVQGSFPSGTSGLAVDGDGRFLATSRYDVDLSALRIVSNEIRGTSTITVDAVEPGSNQRGIALSPAGDRAYVVSREPESILVLDTSLDDDDDYTDRFVEAIEIGAGPSVVRTFADDSHPLGYLVYAVCFAEDRIFVIDPAVNEVVDIILTRRGPHDLTFDPERKVAYLANFLESTVSIIDIDPTSGRFHEILTTLGRPRRPRTND